MSGSLTLGQVRGIPIRAHFTLLLIIPYLAFVMAARFTEVASQAGVAPSSLTVPPLAWGLVLACGLFACVLLHELGHALVALRFGGRVAGITLMLLGGISELRGLPRSPRQEGLVAVAGPLVSLALGLGAWGVDALLRGPPDVRFALYYLGQINLVLAAFNLLPAFPMDGGRVLRALLAWRLPRVKATRIAAGAGIAFAGLFVLLGFMTANLVLALIGVFLWTGAAAERAQAEQEEEWRGLSVRDVMSPVQRAIPGWRSAADAAAWMTEDRLTSLPVVEGDALVGVVALQHLADLSPEARPLTPIAALVNREAPRLQADESLIGALEQLAEHDVPAAPVLEGNRLVGMLEPNDFARAFRLRRLTQNQHPRPRRPMVLVRPPAEEGPRAWD
ncbi:MAG: hypothetical protein RL199_2439 [Pseudomonadota bacterium]|jgi:Zn-dependent protease/predicted transcriptional regulator